MRNMGGSLELSPYGDTGSLSSSLRRGDEVKVRSSGSALIQCDWCPDAKGSLDTEARTEAR